MCSCNLARHVTHMYMYADIYIMNYNDRPLTEFITSRMVYDCQR